MQSGRKRKICLPARGAIRLRLGQGIRRVLRFRHLEAVDQERRQRRRAPPPARLKATPPANHHVLNPQRWGRNGYRRQPCPPNDQGPDSDHAGRQDARPPASPRHRPAALPSACRAANHFAPRRTISTRRFRARPAGVSLDSSGRFWLNPAIASFSAGTWARSVRKTPTSNARSMES